MTRRLPFGYRVRITKKNIEHAGHDLVGVEGVLCPLTSLRREAAATLSKHVIAALYDQDRMSGFGGRIPISDEFQTLGGQQAILINEDDVYEFISPMDCLTFFAGIMQDVEKGEATKRDLQLASKLLAMMSKDIEGAMAKAARVVCPKCGWAVGDEPRKKEGESHSREEIVWVWADIAYAKVDGASLSPDGTLDVDFANQDSDGLCEKNCPDLWKEALPVMKGLFIHHGPGGKKCHEWYAPEDIG